MNSSPPPPLSTQNKHLLRVGHYWLHCKGPATCLCPAVHVSLTVCTRVGGDISPDQARVWRCSSKSRVFWQQPVRLWWNPPAQWVQRIKWVWFPFYERNELLEAWKCFWYWLPPKSCDFWEWENVIIHLRLETNKYSKHTFIRFCVAPYTINNCTRCRVDISDIFTYYILIVIICFRRPSLQPRRVPPRHGAGEGGGELDPILIPSSCHLLIPHPHLRLRL